jgi:hypothetical protein
MPDVGVLNYVVTGTAQPASAKQRKEPVMVDAVAGDPCVHDPTARVSRRSSRRARKSAVARVCVDSLGFSTIEEKRR